MDTICLSRPHEFERQWMTGRYRTVKADCAIVVIETDSGEVGIGEACAYGWPLETRRWVEHYSMTMVGGDPVDPALTPHPNGRDWKHDCAVAGIDCALWDLRGKAAGKPVSRLIRDDAPEDVRLYASGGCRYDWRIDPGVLVEEATEYAQAGLTAMKMRIGTEWSWDGVTVERFTGLLRDVAKAVDGRMDLMVDGNQRLTIEQALTVGRTLDELGFLWFEEPIPQADIDGYVALNEALNLPVTGGEQYTTREQFLPYLERGGYQIVQPDAGICGLTACFEIGHLAAQFGVDICPHSWHNGLMAMANGHLVSALENTRVLELCMHQGPLQWEILADRPEISSGRLALPQHPGLGVELADDRAALEKRFPYIEGNYALVADRTRR